MDADGLAVAEGNDIQRSYTDILNIPNEKRKKHLFLKHLPNKVDFIKLYNLGS